MSNQVITQNRTLTYQENGFYSLAVQSDEEVTLAITVKEKSTVSLFLECLKAKALNLQVLVEEGATCSLLVWNSTTKKLTSFDEAHILKEGTLNLSYGELATADLARKTEIHLDEVGSSIALHSAALSKNEKDFEFTCRHHAANTISNMKNYFVLLEGGSCKMEATGKIDKGAKSSKSHQVSRGLTFDQQKRAIIFPQLLIDENDVEASHATTLGQIDENQMYYLQSRGLSKRQATQLITTGYLMPIADEIENEELRMRCHQEIEEKVNVSCSM